MNNFIFSSEIECYMKGTDEKIGSNNLYLLLLAIVGIAKMKCLAKMKYITDQGTCFADPRSGFANHTLVQTASKIMLEIC